MRITSLDNYDPEKVSDYLVHLTYDPKLFALGQRAWAEALQGFLEKSKVTLAGMFAWADELDHPITTCVANLCALKHANYLLEVEAIEKYSEELCKVAKEHNFSWYLAFGEFFGSWYELMFFYRS